MLGCECRQAFAHVSNRGLILFLIKINCIHNQIYRHLLFFCVCVCTCRSCAPQWRERDMQKWNLYWGYPCIDNRVNIHRARRGDGNVVVCSVSAISLTKIAEILDFHAHHNYKKRMARDKRKLTMSLKHVAPTSARAPTPFTTIYTNSFRGIFYRLLISGNFSLIWSHRNHNCNNIQ